MAKFDRYMLSQLLLYFGFFSLVLAALFWISRAVRLFDRLIGDGHSALVFLEFSALGLPRLILKMMPLAAFAAATYTTNRLSNESEMTVMLATGSSPMRLARPVFVFGLLVMLMMSILSHVLVPAAYDRLSIRESEISQDITARLLIEGAFIHPSEGITLYTREIGDDGVLKDVFVSDQRDPQKRATYTAANAYLVRDENQASLIMLDGLAQLFDGETRRLETTKFRDFSYDISGIIAGPSDQVRGARSQLTLEIIRKWLTQPRENNAEFRNLAVEFHGRFGQPLFAMAAALIGFSILMNSGYSRFGAWREVLLAFGLLLLLDGTRAALYDTVRESGSLWILIYLPALIGIAFSLALLGWSVRTRGVKTSRGAA